MTFSKLICFCFQYVLLSILRLRNFKLSLTKKQRYFSNEGKGSAGKKGASKQVHPPIGQINNESASETPTNKAKTQWSEHVWSKCLKYPICYNTPMLGYMTII